MLCWKSSRSGILDRVWPVVFIDSPLLERGRPPPKDSAQPRLTRPLDFRFGEPRPLAFSGDPHCVHAAPCHLPVGQLLHVEGVAAARGEISGVLQGQHGGGFAVWSQPYTLYLDSSGWQRRVNSWLDPWAVAQLPQMLRQILLIPAQILQPGSGPLQQLAATVLPVVLDAVKPRHQFSVKAGAMFGSGDVDASNGAGQRPRGGQRSQRERDPDLGRQRAQVQD